MVSTSKCQGHQVLQKPLNHKVMQVNIRQLHMLVIGKEDLICWASTAILPIYFSLLSAAGRLSDELSATLADSNPVAHASSPYVVSHG